MGEISKKLGLRIKELREKQGYTHPCAVPGICYDPHRPYDDLPRPLCRDLQQRPVAPPFQCLGASHLSGGRSDLRGPDQLPAVLHVPGTGKDLPDPGLLK